MEERVRDDGYEATFVVATPRDEAWKRLEAAKPAFDALPHLRPGQWWIPGGRVARRRARGGAQGAVACP